MWCLAGGGSWQWGLNIASGTHLCVSVICFFKLHVLPSLAAKVHPLPLQPLHGGFSGQGGRVHLRYEDDIGSCHPQTSIQLLLHCDISVLLTDWGWTLQWQTCNSDYTFWRLFHKEPSELSRLWIEIRREEHLNCFLECICWLKISTKDR